MEHPPRGIATFIVGQNDAALVCETCAKIRGGGASACYQLRKSLHLGQTDRSLHFGHSVVHSEEFMRSTATRTIPSFVHKQARPTHVRFRIDERDAAVTARRLFRLLETETTELPERPDHLPIVFRKMCLSAIFNDGKSMAISQVNDRCNVRGSTKQMYDDDCLRAMRYSFRNRRRG
jgi:hypothetical protein